MDPFTRIVLRVFLATAMLGIGLQVKAQDARSVLAARGLVARSLAANFLVVPALGVLLVRGVPMPPDVETGFLLVAFAPGGLGALQFTTKGKGALFYAGALTFVLALLSIFVSPAAAGLLRPELRSLSVPYTQALGFLLAYLLLPLAVGMAAHARFSGLAEKAGKVLAVISTLTFFAGAVYLRHGRRQAIIELGPSVTAAMLLFIVGSIFIGWLLGGPDAETRRVLASASSMRNAVLCLLIANRDFPSTQVPTAVLAFSALMLPPNLLLTLYALIRNR
jgi:BASS family bile acid:Na+ symporter